jgi:SAM-dependent methyltransferase
MEQHKVYMTNPWLLIPASDYEGHMISPNVAQQPFLAQAFKDSLDNYDCSTVALLGCSTGNGLQYINKQATQRITAIDINPEYLDILRNRYEARVPGLEIMEADLETCALDHKAYSLIFAGLIFEYLQPRILLPKIANWLRSDGTLVSILQLPVKHVKKVSDTPYTSLKKLNSIMNLISAKEFKSMANDAGLREIGAETVTLDSGKPFYVGTYSRC